MGYIYNLENLDCAVCAANIEAGIKKLPGVTKASVSFILQRATVEAESDLREEINKLCKKTHPSCRIK